MCWSYSFESPVSLTPAVVGKSVLVVDGLQLRRLSTPNDACSLAALAETVAEFAPSTSQSLLPGSAGAAMVLAGNGLFLGIGGSIYGIDTATGRTNWSVTVGGEIVSAPAVADGVVYAGSTDGTLYAVADAAAAA